MEKNNRNFSTTYIYDVIAWLRFPLAVAVVLLHTMILDRPINGNIYIIDSAYPYFADFVYIVKNCVGGLAVPLFFFFSGFLFFSNVENISLQTYKVKLRKRLHSLVIPYFLWNSFYLLFVLILGLIIPQWLTYQKSPLNMDLRDVFLAFWDLNQGLTPLWFIRDLILINLLTPLIYLFCKRMSNLSFFIVCVVFLLGWYIYIPSVFSRSMCLYIMGAWFSINRMDIVSTLFKYRILFLVFYFSSVILDYIGIKCPFNNYLIYNAMIVSGMFFVIALVASMNKYGYLRRNKLLEESSFFIYVSHMFIIHLLVKVWMLIVPINTYSLCMAQIIIPIIVSYICVGFYYVLKKQMPTVLKIFVGGR